MVGGDKDEVGGGSVRFLFQLWNVTNLIELASEKTGQEVDF